MEKETYLDIIKKFKKHGISISIGRNLKPGDTYFETIYSEMKKLYANYYNQLQYTDCLDVNLQHRIDINLCVCLYIAQKNIQGDESITDKKKEFLNAIKTFLIDRIKARDLFIIDSIIFEDLKNYNLIFDTPELKAVLNEYIQYGQNKLDELMKKYNDKTITTKEKIILIKLLNSEIIDKDKEFVDQLFKDMYPKEKLANYESEFLVRYISKQKCAEKNIKYVKAYLFEDSKSMRGGGYFPTTNYIEINVSNVSAQWIVFATLHEYEHYCQKLDSLKGILNKNSLAEALYDVFIDHFSNEEYGRNYDFTDIELYANEAAKNEGIKLFLKNKMFLLNRNSHTGVIKPAKTKFWDSIMIGIKRDEKNKGYTINYYNVYHLEKALNAKEEYLNEYPILENFYSRNEKRMKNIQELSVEYAKQDLDGREAFIPFVEYQIANNGLDLDNLDFDSLTDEEKINIMLLIAKHFKDLFARIFLYIKHIQNVGIANNQVFNDEIEIFVKELEFLRRNSEYIKMIENTWELIVSEQTLESEYQGIEEKNNNLFMQSVYETFHFYHTNPILSLSFYANSNIPELMAQKLSNNGGELFEEIPIDKKRKQLLERFKEKIETISLDIQLEQNQSPLK